MPLINIDLYDKWTKEEAKVLLNGIHRAVLSSFGVPERDRYQILRWHKEDEMILEDTGLGFERDKGREVVIQVISRKRTEDSKVAFYKAVAANLKEDLALNPKNLLISIVENGDADWSFADGEAQFLTGKL
ncbi:tautomerase family protein [Lactococcus protaetiae]|uniref:Tautomerase family protein n=1 Tax=Lactococcus protaetiae TaxID=2592653 RepID=A0A514Z630_9LACT|nr:tautomerase family protein [Lactococcus protaetiae]MCL2114310.1 tautomerase family protein [Streptococcaceae bacterium]QDK70061.1 tautomerase family protein [Lactococcus protaetiae]